MSFTLPRLPEPKPKANGGGNWRGPGGISVPAVLVAFIDGAVLGFATWGLLLAAHVHVRFIAAWLAWVTLLLAVATVSSVWHNVADRELMKFTAELSAKAAISATLAALAVENLSDEQKDMLQKLVEGALKDGGA